MISSEFYECFRLLFCTVQALIMDIFARHIASDNTVQRTYMYKKFENSSAEELRPSAMQSDCVSVFHHDYQRLGLVLV